MFRKKFKKSAVVLITSITLCIPITSEAAIPVIDDQNIAQQLKTYMQTIEVVTNTAKQIQLQLQNLLSLPQSVINAYKTAYQNSINKITAIMDDGGFLKPETQWDKVWTQAFPTISSNSSQGFWDERNAHISMQELLSMRNKSDVDSYHKLMQELEQSKARLQDLLEQNQSVEGAKQATQIANEISAEQAHIQSLTAAIQALSVQNQTMNNNSKVQREKNMHAAQESAAAANSYVIQRMHNDLQSEWTAPAIDDPWQKFGNVRW